MQPEDLILLNEQIAAMARAGLPLEQGLDALAREMGRGTLRRVTARLASDLQAGRTLPEAIQRQGRRIPSFYAGLVEAGIRSGRMAEVLATLTAYARTVAGVRTTIVEAALYPAVIFLFAAVILGFVIGYLIPQYGELFREFGLQVPAVTEAILTVGQKPLPYLVAPLLGVAGLLVLTKATLGGTRWGRYWWVRGTYAVPILGTLIRSARLAAFTELLAILVDYGLPLPQAFQLAGDASTDPFLAAGARQARQDLEAGMPLGPVLRSRLLVAQLVAWMTTVGEQRGELGKALHQVADFYRRQVEQRATLLRTILPPFLIVFIAGLVVCLFVFALILPVVRLIEGLSK